MRALLCSARVAAVPVDMGTGTPMKVFEALEAGCAVVATPAAAARAKVDGRPAPLRAAGDSASFAREVAALLGDEAAAAAAGDAGREFVVAHADRSAVALRLAERLRAAAAGS
jgi:glycosyltransferase involved in cell wall biosynthesis